MKHLIKKAKFDFWGQLIGKKLISDFENFQVGNLYVDDMSMYNDEHSDEEKAKKLLEAGLINKDEYKNLKESEYEDLEYYEVTIPAGAKIIDVYVKNSTLDTSMTVELNGHKIEFGFNEEVVKDEADELFEGPIERDPR